MNGRKKAHRFGRSVPLPVSRGRDRGSSRIRYAYTVNYSKGDNYYTADNGDGWHVSLKYEGNQIMSIDLDAPPKDNSAASSPVPDSAQSPN